ncbi:type II secretion system F family protein [Clostridium sp. C105KSO13]|uniref:type II secretion system F family protein n=1 Tax=Clostridium sp. C105KSO13 TaxID=1776045 RepID=UPI000740864E|nr:type II secretion system F family protein [Clostridium sp. C105KSO13]CUX37110.1 Bacterial type II secretion system protein F domain protein [Clostridium sp. C105KSO13]
MVAYLFYDTWVAVLLLLPALCYYLQAWQRTRCKAKEEEFREQFKESIQALASALNVGYSVENAIRETAKDIKPLFRKDARIRKELSRMIHQLDVNQTVEQVMTEFADRVNQEDVRNFVTVFVAARHTGGDSITIIRNAVRDISDKIEVEKEIQTLLAAKKLEFKIMCVIPFGILLYMRLAFPEFMEVLYGNLLGAGLMTCCLGVYGTAYKLGKSMVEIEV